MPRNLFCAGCHIYMGEVRSATLKKGMVVLCEVCETKRKASDLASKTSPRGMDIPEFMRDIMRGR